MKKNVNLNELSKEIYDICVLGKTEPPFSGKYNKFNKNGNYFCIICGNLLFISNYKYDSGSGWPSFYQAAYRNSLNFKEDNSYNMKRTEVLCNNCNAHLGHVFDDGPAPTSKRFCINSLALDFKEGT